MTVFLGLILHARPKPHARNSLSLAGRAENVPKCHPYHARARKAKGDRQRV